jgi:hypothetical protein
VTARADGYAEEYTRAAARVEQLFATNPAELGESRPGHGRLVVELPLAIEFEVHVDQRVAVITRVTYTRPRSQR